MMMHGQTQIKFKRVNFRYCTVWFFYDNVL